MRDGGRGDSGRPQIKSLVSGPSRGCRDQRASQEGREARGGGLGGSGSLRAVRAVPASAFGCLGFVSAELSCVGNQDLEPSRCWGLDGAAWSVPGCSSLGGKKRKSNNKPLSESPCVHEAGERAGYGGRCWAGRPGPGQGRPHTWGRFFPPSPQRPRCYRNSTNVGDQKGSRVTPPPERLPLGRALARGPLSPPSGAAE